MEGGDNWDLHAVVRGCCSTTTTTNATTAAAATISPSFTDQSIFLADFDVDDVSNKYSSYSDHFNFSLQQQEQPPFEEKNTNTFDQELHELFRPFFTLSARSPPPQSPQYQQPQPPPPLPPPSLSNVLQITQQKPLHQVLKQQSHPPSHVNIPRSKRRKNQQKTVCQVPAENLSSDIWAWRKYGQKPIKGSPYPRGYYRCSSSKGCLARKQVERSRSDPGIFIVTYTAEHNHPAPTHRNSLAGSTRQKSSFTAGQTVTVAGDGSKSQPRDVPISGPSSSSSPSLELEDDQVFMPQMMIGTTCVVECKEEEKEDWGEEELGLEDDDEFGISEMQVAVAGDDNLLVDCFEVDQVLDGTTRPEASAECFPDLFPPSFGGLSWTVNNAATAAGGI